MPTRVLAVGSAVRTDAHASDGGRKPRRTDHEVMLWPLPIPMPVSGTVLGGCDRRDRDQHYRRECNNGQTSHVHPPLVGGKTIAFPPLWISNLRGGRFDVRRSVPVSNLGGPNGRLRFQTRERGGDTRDPPVLDTAVPNWHRLTIGDDPGCLSPRQDLLSDIPVWVEAASKEAYLRTSAADLRKGRPLALSGGLRGAIEAKGACASLPSSPGLRGPLVSQLPIHGVDERHPILGFTLVA